jgi:hypothetical protein
MSKCLLVPQSNELHFDLLSSSSSDYCFFLVELAESPTLVRGVGHILMNLKGLAMMMSHHFLIGNASGTCLGSFSIASKTGAGFA